MTLSELEEKIGEGFVKIHRGCIVSAMAIHDITDKINLINGESLVYTIRKKNLIIEQIHTIQKRIISSFAQLPFAFADIEMVFNEERRAVDWIFRYGNPALAQVDVFCLIFRISHLREAAVML